MLCRTQIGGMGLERTREVNLCENASQADFDRYLNVEAGPSSLQERGKKRTRYASLKLPTLSENCLTTVA